jgi:branched-chain amino acid transport system ATP-binding protein
MLQVKEIDVYYGNVQALYGITIDARLGKITNLVGSNGAGKTTLMKCISGLLRPASGSIIFNDDAIEMLPPHKIVERGLVQVPEGRKLFPSLSIRENLELGSTHEHTKKKRRESLDYVFQLFPRLLERKNQLAGTLSGGEQQMLAFGRALMALPRVLLLDEPSLGLAPILVRDIFQTVKKINRDGGTILLVEQNVRASLALASWTYVMETGHIITQGRSEDLKGDERIAKAFLGMREKKGGDDDKNTVEVENDRKSKTINEKRR